MDKRIIFEEGYNKYYRASLPRCTVNSGNISFEELLFFIGLHNPYKDKSEIGSAYIVLRQKTNELLGVDRRNFILRTSKKEIASLRFYYKNLDKRKNPLFVKIPFKIEYIFRAIIIIIDEMKDRGINIPTNLQKYITMEYGNAFYSEYKDAYEACFSDIPLEATAQRELSGDFTLEASSLRVIFK